MRFRISLRVALLGLVLLCLSSIGLFGAYRYVRPDCRILNITVVDFALDELSLDVDINMDLAAPEWNRHVKRFEFEFAEGQWRAERGMPFWISLGSDPQPLPDGRWRHRLLLPLRAKERDNADTYHIERGRSYRLWARVMGTYEAARWIESPLYEFTVTRH